MSIALYAAMDSSRQPYLTIIKKQRKLPLPTYFESIHMKNRSITVHGADMSITTRHDQDYISLTDMVKRFGDEIILYGWLRNRSTIEFLGIWEQIYNPAFKPIEFDRFKNQAGSNSFSLSPKNG
jgi:hypothetical protein